MVWPMTVHPTNCARDTDPEDPRRLVPRKTVLYHGLDHPNAKSLSCAILASLLPAVRMNHASPDLGIPSIQFDLNPL